jgi:hypothetical protein
MKRFLMIVPGLLLVVAAVRAQPPYGPEWRGRAPNLNGTWYMGGDGDLPCFIQQRPHAPALFTNENGDSAWGDVRGDRVWIPDWSPGDGVLGLEGRVRGDRIFWPDGHFWSRWAR